MIKISQALLDFYFYYFNHLQGQGHTKSKLQKSGNILGYHPDNIEISNHIFTETYILTNSSHSQKIRTDLNQSPQNHIRNNQLFRRSVPKRMSKQYVAIKKEYLKEETFLELTENSLAINQHYSDYCSWIQKEYKNFQSSVSAIIQSSKSHLNSKYQFVTEFRNYIIDFCSIIFEISSFQNQCLESLKSNCQGDLQISKEMIARIRQCNSLHQKTQEVGKILSSSFADLRGSFIKFKHIKANPEMRYDEQIMDQCANILSSKLKATEKNLDTLLQTKQIQVDKGDSYDPIFTKYRKKLVKNKYVMHKKFFDLNQNSRYCIAEMIFLIQECIRTRHGQFLKVTRQENDDITILKRTLDRSSIIEGRNDAFLERAVRQAIQEYRIASEQIINIADTVIAQFEKIKDRMEDERQKFKNYLIKIDNFYDPKETVSKDLLKTLEIFQFVGKTFFSASQELKKLRKQLCHSKNSCQKHTQIVLSLIKLKNSQQIALTRASTQQRFSGSRFSKEQDKLEALAMQISFLQVKQMMLSVYQMMEKYGEESLLFFQAKQDLPTQIGNLPNRSIAKDSMEITMKENRYSVPVKKPMKQQLWLWKDWHQQIQFDFTVYIEQFKEIENVIGETKKSMEAKGGDCEMQRFKCAFIGQKSNNVGSLIVKAKNLCFEANNNSKNLVIPWKDIDDFVIASKMLQKYLIVKVNNAGEITFGGFDKINSVVQSLKEYNQKQSSGNVKMSSKQKVVLSEEQLKQIKERRIKISGDLRKQSEFNPVVSQMFQGEQIDDIYDLFYSDKTFNFYGREQICFFSFCGKKGGNYDWTASKYDHQGPKFYTLAQDVSFSNCPLYSERKFNYKHPLPSIPFMPNFCDNIESRRLYWISNEQFDYLLNSQTAGIPMAENFYVQILHKVKKVEKGVSVEVFLKINFRKQTFKGLIINQTEPQVKQNMTMILGEMQKILKLRKAGASGKAQAILQQAQFQENKQSGNDDIVKKLELRNKMLIIGFALLVLLNIISHIW